MAQPPAPATVIGIDLGASSSRVTQLDVTRKMPVVARNALSNEATPTISSYPAVGQRLFGEAAMGKEISRASETVTDLKHWVSSGDLAARSVGERELTADAVLAFHLKQLLSYAKNAKDASIIAVSEPNTAAATYADSVRVAVDVAGFDASRVIIVPEAHAVATYFHHLQFGALPAEDATPLPVVICNIGSQYSSFTAIEVRKGHVVHKATRAVAAGSNCIDEAIAKLVFDDIAAKKKTDIRGHQKSYAKVLREARKAKEMLSSVDRTTVQCECLKDDIDATLPLSRREMDEAAAPFLAQLAALIAELKVAAALPAGADLRVEAIGGAWRSACVQQLIKDGFGVERVGVSLDSSLAVAEGTAIAALIAAGDIGGDAREPTHKCQVDGVAPLAMEPLSDELQRRAAALREVEREMDTVDEAVKARLRAVDAVESFLFCTRRAAEEAIKDAATRGVLEARLDKLQTWLDDDCEDAVTADIASRLEAETAAVASEFPQLAEFEAARREEQRRKDEELERLSKLQEEDKELKSDPQRLRAAQQRREQGVALFKQEHYQEAQTRFVQALAILGQLYAPSAEDVKPKKDEIAISCHLNVASCSVKLGMWRNAVNNCTSVLEIDGQQQNAKALYRRGQARAALHEHDEAMKDLLRARDLTNGDAAIVAEIEALERKIEGLKAKEKKMFSKMFA